MALQRDRRHLLREGLPLPSSTSTPSPPGPDKPGLSWAHAVPRPKMSLAGDFGACAGVVAGTSQQRRNESRRKRLVFPEVCRAPCVRPAAPLSHGDTSWPLWGSVSFAATEPRAACVLIRLSASLSVCSMHDRGHRAHWFDESVHEGSQRTLPGARALSSRHVPTQLQGPLCKGPDSIRRRSPHDPVTPKDPPPNTIPSGVGLPSLSSGHPHPPSPVVWFSEGGGGSLAHCRPPRRDTASHAVSDCE